MSSNLTTLTTLDDDGKLKRRYINKRVNAAKENIPFKLSFEEYVRLLIDAEIKSSDLGIKKYHLSRYNDSGSYVDGNCRFVWYTVNLGEKKISEKSRIASRENAKRATIAAQSESAVKKRMAILAPIYAKRKEEAEERRKEQFAMAHPSYRGERNSQFGTYWITNEIENKKWSEARGPMPTGFRRGCKSP